MQAPRSRPKIGFVLSGGGSRGAYEAGIIHYLRTDLAKRMGRQPPIDIVTGTSVGAINAAFLAATAADPVSQAEQIVSAWRALRIEELISLKGRDVLRAGRMMLGGDPPPPAPGSFRYGGLLDTQGLERFVLRVIPWRGIDRSLRERHLSAISVSATHVGTGHTVVFLSSSDPMPREWSRDPFVRHRAARIGPRHVLASAAIPMLFPAVKIGDEFFTDGGLRQNTPMSPAIRLGADRMLLVSLRHVKPQPKIIEKERTEAYPKPLFLAGKALNALLLDHTEYDLARMQRINLILEAGHASFGDRFEAMMNQELVKLRGAPLRRIQAVHIRPSEDIGAIAAAFVRSGRMKVDGMIARRLISRLAAGEAAHESDLLSYLLFDGDFASELIELGRRDARAKEDDLAALFDVEDGKGAAENAPAEVGVSAAKDRL
ncbi:MAG: patatin-like phospholipase family protein [Deltaproteobacteria bacterium]|nr:patatin-like phospholipase family protein [Deltaproteobacteria bacterium]MCW5805485.1 patatin-like phospholipase family protein [Deltaproteobacteria bacterium]